METKHSKWLRLSESRKSKIQEQLRLITNLSNKSNYDFEPEEARELFESLRDMVNEAEKLYLDRKFRL